MTSLAGIPGGSPTQQVRDRIAQAYLGLWGDSATQERARRRLHWLAKHCVGDKVLDIGCSEGILAILLAREGFSVTGVDINPDEIEYARELLGQEHDFVQSRIEFILSDVLSADLDKSGYDTVVLGEVIEHLVRPELMIDRALKLTKPGGRLLLTTPFGYFPDIDHRQSFVLTQLVNILSSRCEPLELSIKDGYIRFAGLNQTPDKQSWHKYDRPYLLALTEKATIEQQHILHDRLDTFKKQQKQSNQDLEQNKQIIAESKKTCASLTEKIQAMQKADVVREGEIGRIKRQMGELQSEYDKSLSAINQLKDQLLQAGNREHLLLDQIKRIESEKERMQIRNTQLYEGEERLRENLETIRAKGEGYLKDYQLKLKEMEQLRDLANGLQEDLKRVNQHSESQNREIALLREQLDSAQAENQRTWNELEKRNGEVSRLGELAETAQNKASLIEAAIHDRDTRIAEINASLSKLSKQAELLKSEKEKLFIALESAESAGKKELESIRKTLTEEKNRARLLIAENENLATRAKRLTAENERLSRALDRDTTSKYGDQISGLTSTQSNDTQALVNKIQLHYDNIGLLKDGDNQTAGFDQQEIDRIKGYIRNLEEQKHALEQNILSSQALTGQLKQGHLRLQNSYDMLAKREYLARTRSQEVEQTIAYRLGIAITQAMAHPGIRSMRRVMSVLGNSIKQGRRKLKGVSDPVVMDLDVTMPDGSRKMLTFTCVQPEKLTVTGQQIHFNQPANESVILIAKPSAKITEVAGAQALPLKPDQPYMLSGKFTLQGGRASLQLIEYSREYCLHGREYPLRTGDWRESWRTHIDHAGLCLAFELQGKGTLNIDQFLVEKTSQRAATTQVKALNKDQDGDKPVPLSKTPIQFTVKAPRNAMLVIKGRLRIHEETDRKPGYALAKITYLDHNGNALPGPYKDVSYSKTIGWYNYLRLPENKNVSSELMRLSPPPEAARISLAFQTWKARNAVEIINQLEISEQDLWAFPRFEKPEPKSQGKPVVASILDPFSEECFRYDLDLVPLSLQNWQKEIEAAAPKLLLVESAWQGNSGQWSSVLTQYANQPENPLKQLLDYCRRQGLPTVFWNKEDPPNFDVFIDAARDFDHIFTTDQDCVPEYRKRCGHDRVYCLPFAAQPAIHNPIGKQEIGDYDIAFAGTWYKRKHPERSELLPNVLDPSRKYHLYIFDRMSDWLSDDAYQFPEEYKPFLHHKISYEEMLYVHRAFKLILNTNSVINSPTMFSRRVFEILASATPVVSTASRGVQEMFGDLVPVVVGQAQAQQQIDLLMANPWYRKQLGHLGYRRVMLEHTVDKRVRELLSQIGMGGLNLPDEFPKVSLAIATNRPSNLDQVQENFRRQNYPNLELILVLNSEAFDKSAVERRFAEHANVKIFQLPSSASLGQCLNKSIDEASGEYWAKMDDDDIYLANYITDMMLPFRYSQADIVGKTTYFLYMERTNELMLRFAGHEHNYEDVVSGSTLLIKRSVFNQVRFPETTVGEDSQFLAACLEIGFRIYAADCFNCVIMRKADTSRHTWEIEEADLLRHCRKVCDNLQMEFVDPDLGTRQQSKLMDTPVTVAEQPAPAAKKTPVADMQPRAELNLPPVSENFADLLDPETIDYIMKRFNQKVFDLKRVRISDREQIRFSDEKDNLQLFPSADAFFLPVRGGWMYELRGFGHSPQGKFEKAALIQFIFLDSNRQIIDDQYPFTSFSKNNGNFKYLPVATGGVENIYDVVTPADAATMIVGFRHWNTKEAAEVAPVWNFEDRGKFVSPEDFAKDYDRFFDVCGQSQSDTMVFLFAGTKSIGMAHRGNRPMRFARLIADRGIPIIYNYYRWRSSADIVKYDGRTLFQSPIDVTAMKMVDIATHEYPQKRKIFMLSMPNSDAVKYLGLFKQYGWTVIYECRDDWEEFWKVGVGKWYHPLLEQFVTAKSDGVTTVSCTLADKMAKWRLPGTSRPRVIPNGLDPAFTNRRVRDYVELRRQQSTGQTVIGYHGHLTGAWFDWDLVIDTARRKPDWRFEIIGFDAPADLDLPANVEYMGPKSHEEIQEIAIGWTVTIIPFKPSKLAEGVDPIKVYEYLAMGLPVVSVHMPQILDYPCVRCYHDGSQLLGMLEEALLAPFDIEHVEEWLKTRTWEDRIDETFAFVDELRTHSTLTIESLPNGHVESRGNGKVRLNMPAPGPDARNSSPAPKEKKKVSRKLKKQQQKNLKR